MYIKSKVHLYKTENLIKYYIPQPTTSHKFLKYIQYTLLLWCISWDCLLGFSGFQIYLAFTPKLDLHLAHLSHSLISYSKWKIFYFRNFATRKFIRIIFAFERRPILIHLINININMDLVMSFVFKPLLKFHPRLKLQLFFHFLLHFHLLSHFHHICKIKINAILMAWDKFY